MPEIPELEELDLSPYDWLPDWPQDEPEDDENEVENIKARLADGEWL